MVKYFPLKADSDTLVAEQGKKKQKTTTPKPATRWRYRLMKWSKTKECYWKEEEKHISATEEVI